MTFSWVSLLIHLPHCSLFSSQQSGQSDPVKMWVFHSFARNSPMACYLRVAMRAYTFDCYLPFLLLYSFQPTCSVLVQQIPCYFQTCQAYSYLRIFAPTHPSAWSTLPPNSLTSLSLHSNDNLVFPRSPYLKLHLPTIFLCPPLNSFL